MRFIESKAPCKREHRQGKECFFRISDFALSFAHPALFFFPFLKKRCPKKSTVPPLRLLYKMARSITYALLALLGLVATNGVAAARKYLELE